MAGEENPRAMMATSSGYCYSDASSTENPQIYHFTSPMEITGFPYKNLINSNNNQHMNDFATNHQTMMLSWNHHRERLVVDDPSQRCVFSQDGNQNQSQQSLSLSLTSPDHSNSMSVNHLRMIQQQFQIRNSKYLEPAKELLNQLCNLNMENSESKLQNYSAAVRTQPPPLAVDLLELQRRKTKLFQMLQEVKGRYKHYCHQMKSVVSSFEAVAGDGAAEVYSFMAARAMSRHFRCLKDGIVSQIKATNMAMREKDEAIPGATKGETPRLRILDVNLRQQRAIGMVENHPWRPQRGLPEKAVALLRAWLFEHFLHPYPSEVDKRILARQTGLSRSQVSNWFINARVRLWKPMVEEMYMEDQKEEQGPTIATDDRKPTQDELMMRRDSECLSSIINTPTTKDGFSRGGDDMMQFDFTNYGGGGGVSLTLGLQGGGGVSLASGFYDRDEMEHSMMESENQNLQYRNMMGAQLLHDLAG